MVFFRHHAGHVAIGGDMVVPSLEQEPIDHDHTYRRHLYGDIHILGDDVHFAALGTPQTRQAVDCVVLWHAGVHQRHPSALRAGARVSALLRVRRMPAVFDGRHRPCSVCTMSCALPSSKLTGLWTECL